MGITVNNIDFSKVATPQLRKSVDSSTGFTSGEPIDYSIDLARRIILFLSSIHRPFRKVRRIPFEEPVRSQVYRFMIALDAYYESKNPVIPFKRIMEIVELGPEGASLLKRIRTKSNLIRFSSEPLEEPDWWNEVEGYAIDHIGDIFNFAYLIHWKEDVDDAKEGFLPLPETLDETKELFEKLLTDLLKDVSDIEIVQPESILLENSGSTCSVNPNKTTKVYLEKEKVNKFARRWGYANRIKIPVGPANTRDALTVDLPTLNRCKWIDKQVRCVLDKLKNHLHLDNPNRINSRIKRFGNKYRFFYQRDFHKEGITKPRWILKSMIKVLKSRFPNADAFEYPDFFESFSYYDGNEERIVPPRGHGLGFANALTTLMQLTLLHNLKEYISDEGRSIKNKFEFLAMNDDIVIGIEDEDDLETIVDLDYIICSQNGLIVNKRKSFTSERRFVVIERYWPLSEYEKESYQRREVLLPLCACNITHAKSVFSSSVINSSDLVIDDYFKELISFWGYEFFEDEFKYPPSVGGWFSKCINGVSLE
jgi:hypothetical protein